jgi:2-C-methyl-D-erythritol 2,4-cyclodiphosphate synthase
MRIGHGFDIHRFIDDKPLILGGVSIPHPRGMLGHSDGDVVLHAICDALLGAAGLGDIGRHFSDKDTQWRGADSRIFLRQVHVLLAQRGYAVHNVDVTIIAEAPKLASYAQQMVANIAQDLHIPLDTVNIKATTMEKLGPIGQEEAIAAHAVVLITKI